MAKITHGCITSGAHHWDIVTQHFEGGLPYLNLRRSVWYALGCWCENERQGEIEWAVWDHQNCRLQQFMSLARDLKRSRKILNLPFQILYKWRTFKTTCPGPAVQASVDVKVHASTIRKRLCKFNLHCRRARRKSLLSKIIKSFGQINLKHLNKGHDTYSILGKEPHINCKAWKWKCLVVWIV